MKTTKTNRNIKSKQRNESYKDESNRNFTTEKWNNWNKNFHWVGLIQNEDDKEKSQWTGT